MSAEAQSVFFFIAFVCFVVAVFLSVPPKEWWQALVAAGLASWIFVSLWTAIQAT